MDNSEPVHIFQPLGDIYKLHERETINRERTEGGWGGDIQVATGLRPYPSRSR